MIGQLPLKSFASGSLYFANYENTSVHNIFLYCTVVQALCFRRFFGYRTEAGGVWINLLLFDETPLLNCPNPLKDRLR